MRSTGEILIALVESGLTDAQKALVLELAALATSPPAERQARPRDKKATRLSAKRWEPIRLAVLERDGEVCTYCSSIVGPFEVDHVIPWTRGGSHDLENLVVACRPCNRSKKDMTPEEWGGRTCR